MQSVLKAIQWSAWQPLAGPWDERVIPKLPGLYRIRRLGRTDLDYIGQTGRFLTQRLRMLQRGVYAPEMPYRDPHTAAPPLWALRHATGCDYEVSVAMVEGSDAWRKGVEALAIAIYRQEKRRSPTVEFGRMLAGYRMSSSNNAVLVKAGKRFRGGPTLETEVSHLPGLPPVGTLNGHPQGADWGGHAWSSWVSVTHLPRLPSHDARGLYRFRGSDPDRLLYIGEGRVRHRITHHLAKRRDLEDRQGRLFGAEPIIESSWVLSDVWLRHQRLELENDLIAAHLLVTGDVPAAQFLSRAS